MIPGTQHQSNSSRKNHFISGHYRIRFPCYLSKLSSVWHANQLANLTESILVPCWKLNTVTSSDGCWLNSDCLNGIAARSPGQFGMQNKLDLKQLEHYLCYPLSKYRRSKAEVWDGSNCTSTTKVTYPIREVWIAKANIQKGNQVACKNSVVKPPR